MVQFFADYVEAITGQDIINCILRNIGNTIIYCIPFAKIMIINVRVGVECIERKP